MSETVECPVCGKDREKLHEISCRVSGVLKSARVCVLCAIEWHETLRVTRDRSIEKFEEFWKNLKEKADLSVLPDKSAKTV
jgi:hypothetical protein